MLNVQVAYHVPDMHRGALINRDVVKRVMGAVRSAMIRRVKEGKGVTAGGILFWLPQTSRRAKIFPRSGKWPQVATTRRVWGYGDFPGPIIGGENRGEKWAYFSNGYLGVKNANAKKNAKYQYTGKLLSIRGLLIEITGLNGRIVIAEERRKIAKYLQYEHAKGGGRWFGMSSRERTAMQRAVGREIGIRVVNMVEKTYVRKGKKYRGTLALPYRVARQLEQELVARGILTLPEESEYEI